MYGLFCLSQSRQHVISSREWNICFVFPGIKQHSKNHFPSMWHYSMESLPPQAENAILSWVVLIYIVYYKFTKLFGILEGQRITYHFNMKCNPDINLNYYVFGYFDVLLCKKEKPSMKGTYDLWLEIVWSHNLGFGMDNN